MNGMKNVIVVMLFVMTSVSVAFAGIDHDDIAANFNNLSESQKAEIITAIAQKKTQNDKQVTEINKDMTVENISEWAELGANVGTALVGVAAKLGIATDELLKSTTGKIAMTLIVWKMLGTDILGIALLMVGVPFWMLCMYIFTTKTTFETVNTKNKDNECELTKVKTGRKFTSENSAAVSVITLLILVILSVLLIIF